mmetsp:Transcript_14669/g.58653  ORF Transcript_14669/g.58653 Transcript_14669/m.58653 type:complete len:264 (-) Transcript_14669:1068-1859(-)
MSPFFHKTASSSGGRSPNSRCVIVSRNKPRYLMSTVSWLDVSMFSAPLVYATVCAAHLAQALMTSPHAASRGLVRRRGLGMIGVRASAGADDDLTTLERYVIRGRGTEPAFSSPLNGEKRAGTYACRACGAALFESRTKFDSGTGWPSFWDAVKPNVGRRREVAWKLVAVLTAITFGPVLWERVLPSPWIVLVFGLLLRFYAVREEVVCSSCDAHLGHVFPDGPRETTGLRYCINGVSLSFAAGAKPGAADEADAADKSASSE